MAAGTKTRDRSLVGCPRRALYQFAVRLHALLTSRESRQEPLGQGTLQAREACEPFEYKQASNIDQLSGEHPATNLFGCDADRRLNGASVYISVGFITLLERGPTELWQTEAIMSA